MSGKAFLIVLLVCLARIDADENKMQEPQINELQ